MYKRQDLVNPGHEYGYRNFPNSQIEAFIDLALGILSRHPIPARNVVGHSDIAPKRKIDPGERFDWSGLAAEGIGLWPNEFKNDNNYSDFISMLSEYGYDISSPSFAITAFQRHFHPETINENINSESLGRLKGLIELSNA